MSGGPSPRGEYSNAGRGGHDGGRANFGPNYSNRGGGRGTRPDRQPDSGTGNYDNYGQYGHENRQANDSRQRFDNQRGPPPPDFQSRGDYNREENAPSFQNQRGSMNQGYRDRPPTNYDQPSAPPNQNRQGSRGNNFDRRFDEGLTFGGSHQAYRGNGHYDNQRSYRNNSGGDFHSSRSLITNMSGGPPARGGYSNAGRGGHDGRSDFGSNYSNRGGGRGARPERQPDSGTGNYDNYDHYGNENGRNQGSWKQNQGLQNGYNENRQANDSRQRFGNQNRQSSQGNNFDHRFDEGRTFGGPQQAYRSDDTGRYDNQSSYRNNSGDDFHSSRNQGQSSTRGGYSGAGGRGGSTFGGGNRGGYSSGLGSNRGGYSSGRGGYQNNSNGPGESNYNSNTGVNRYESRYEGNNRDNNRNDDSRAPRDYKPQVRDVHEIFEEDKELAQRDDCRLDEDADVEIDETNEKLITEHWNEMDLHPKVVENIMKSGYVRPRKVQQHTIPYILSGYDCKVQCETGSGKTAAFFVPIISELAKGFEKNELRSIPDAPLAIVVAPTRELTTQLFEQAKKFAADTKVMVAFAYGQYAYRQNLADLKRGCHVLCATLGRLLQLIKEERITLEALKYLVIDEADRLLVGNNREELMEMINYKFLPAIRQTLLFSATLEDFAVTNFAKGYMNNDLIVKITASAKSNRRLEYEIYAVPDDRSKHQAILAYLKKITKEGNVPRVLIFVNKKIDTDRVAMALTVKGYNATTIHGDRGQHLREEAMRSFRSNQTKILVATDVCARGVDIKDLDYVVNFDLPNDDSTFVQRCGRTGRTHKGVAASFYVEYSDQSSAESIAMTMEAAGQDPPAFLRTGVHNEDFVLLNEDGQDGDQQPIVHSPQAEEVPQQNSQPTSNGVEDDSGWD